MAEVNAWNVPAGTQGPLKIHRHDFKAIGGAIEHKNRPEAVYITLSSWVKPKLLVVKAKNTSTDDPSKLAAIVAREFEDTVNRFSRKIGSCFDPKFFDVHSVISTIDYSPHHADPMKRQFFELEINIDTVNVIDHKGQPAQNHATGKIEMYTYKMLEPHIAQAIDKVLSMEIFDPNKASVSFAVSKGER